jgi:GT2 family glycosyltransferase
MFDDEYDAARPVAVGLGLLAARRDAADPRRAARRIALGGSPMISVVLSVRNNAQQASNCLASLVRAFALLKTPCEFILIDDNSDAQQNVPQLFEQFRQQISGPKVTAMLFKQHQHYTRALAYGFSAAQGRHVLFVSHDMLVTAEYVRTLMAVAASDESFGLVRGTSPFVDCFPEHRVAPPLPMRTLEDLEAFARFVSDYHGLSVTEDRLLTGDSMLIKREVLDKIGVFDPRFFGYFGDIDFGLRLQRAGFRMVCAKGAWLWHEGQGAYKDQARQTATNYQVIHQRRMEVVNAAYMAFREKWDSSMPSRYQGTDAIDLAKLRAAPSPAGGEFQAPITPDPAVCEVRG